MSSSPQSRPPRCCSIRSKLAHNGARYPWGNKRHTCGSGDSWRSSPATLHVTNMFFSPHRLHNAYWLVDSRRVEPHLTPLTRGGSTNNWRMRVRWGEVGLDWVFSCENTNKYNQVWGSSQRCWPPPSNHEAERASRAALAGWINHKTTHCNSEKWWKMWAFLWFVHPVSIPKLTCAAVIKALFPARRGWYRFPAAVRWSQSKHGLLLCLSHDNMTLVWGPLF